VVTDRSGCVGERGPAVDERWVRAGSQGECGAVCLAGVRSPTRQAVQQATAPDRAVWREQAGWLGKQRCRWLRPALPDPPAGELDRYTAWLDGFPQRW